MKKIFYIIIALILYQACSQPAPQQPPEQETVIKSEISEFKEIHDSIGKTINGVNIYSTVTIDFPISGSEILVNALKEYLLEEFSLSFSDINTGENFVRKIVSDNVESLSNELDEDFQPPSLYQECEIKKVFENDKIVTYLTEGYDYYGGAHGLQYIKGTTFRKSDGKVFGSNILKNDGWTNIQNEVNQSLMDYFGVKTVEELAKYLFMESNKVYFNGDSTRLIIQQPYNQPFIVNDSLVCYYGAYEIAPYASGTPEVKIALKDIKNNLSPVFKETCTRLR